MSTGPRAIPVAIAPDGDSPATSARPEASPRSGSAPVPAALVSVMAWGRVGIRRDGRRIDRQCDGFDEVDFERGPQRETMDRLFDNGAVLARSWSARARQRSQRSGRADGVGQEDDVRIGVDKLSSLSCG